jgi:hypothetical protein
MVEIAPLGELPTYVTYKLCAYASLPIFVSSTDDQLELHARFSPAVVQTTGSAVSMCLFGVRFVPLNLLEVIFQPNIKHVITSKRFGIHEIFQLTNILGNRYRQIE